MEKVRNTYLPKGTHEKIDNIAIVNGISKLDAFKVLMNEDYERENCSRAGCRTFITRESGFCKEHKKHDRESL